MATLRIRPTVAGHVNALRHAAGLLKGRLRADERRELEKSLSDYRRHRVARGVPLALLRGFLARARNPYLRRQIYLRPFPDGLLDVG